MENAPLEPLTHLADGIGINNVSLFIGDQIAASDGNDPILMFAAVHMLHGMLHQTFPEMYVVKPIFDKNSSFANRPQKYAPVIFGANFSQQAKSQAENCQR